MSIDTRLQELGDRLERSVAADLRAAQRSPTTSRVRRRPVMIGIAATGLAAAGVAILLAAGSGSGSTAAGGAGAGGSALSPATGPARAQDTAYIVRRVEAKIADGDTAQQSFSYHSGNVSADGSLVNLGTRTGHDLAYTAPDGTEYDHSTEFDRNGRPTIISDVVDSAVVKHTQRYSALSIDITHHTYSRYHAVYHVPAASGRVPVWDVSPSSSPSQLRQALRSQQVTEVGTPMFQGRRAIALLMTPKLRGLRGGQRDQAEFTRRDEREVLYVDARSYQPLGEAAALTKASGKLGEPRVSAAEVTYWVPATPGRIAKAKDHSIPTGYREVKDGS